MRIISRLSGACAAAMLLIWATPANALCQALSNTSLVDYVTAWEATIPRAGSEKFIPPSQEEMSSFALALEQLFEGSVGSLNGACTSFDALNYDVFSLRDSASNRTYSIARERSNSLFRGGGMYVVDDNYERNVVIQSPHVVYEINTVREGAQLTTALGARALFLAGVHRCANDEESPCSGMTSVCDGENGPFRISDACHYMESYFHAAHGVTIDFTPVPTAIQLHGQSSEPVVVELSDGTKAEQPDTARVNRLRLALSQKGVSAASCNRKADKPQSLNLCGTTNVQGRLSNGSGDACTQAASRGSGLFLHLEQKRSIRDNPTALIAALKEVFSPDGPGAVAVKRAGKGFSCRSCRH